MAPSNQSRRVTPARQPLREPNVARAAAAAVDRDSAPVRPPWMPRFGIAEMMLAVLIFCVMGAAASYLRVAVQNNNGTPIFVIFTLASPMALVLVLSAYLGLKKWFRSL